MKNYLSIILFLISFNALSFNYNTFREHIAQRNYAEIDMMFMDLDYSGEKIDINRRLDNNGNTALMLASLHSAPRVMELLIDSASLYSYPINFNALNRSNDSAVTLASFTGCVECLDQLLFFGAKSTNIGPDRKDAIYIAAASWKMNEDTRYETISLLLKMRRSDVEYVDLSSNENALLALIKDTYFREIKDFKTIYLLLKAGSRINIKSKLSGETPLHFAAAIGDLDLVKAFISEGAYYTIKNNSGRTAADTAKFHGHLSVSKYLNSLK